MTKVYAAIYKGIKLPTSSTLKKYGLSTDDWLGLYYAQDGKCACGKPLGERVCIDHMHVKGWKKMSPDERKKYVRGLTDWRCNYHFLGKGMTAEIAENLADYLKKFEDKIKNAEENQNSPTRTTRRSK